MREYPVLELFRDVVVSGEVKMCKPELEIFRLALQRFGVVPHETLFVDDNPANVAAAEVLGMGAMLFTDAAALRDGLKLAGLL